MRERHTPERSQPDWARVDKMADQDINFSENPPLGEDFWAEAIRWPEAKKQLTLRLDSDVLEFFGKQGK